LRREDPLSVIVNPRGLITNGGDTLLAYVEAYRLGESAVAVPFELRDARDSVILHDSLRFQGGRDVESKVLRLSPNSAPLGGLTLAVGAGDQRRTVRILSSISQHLVLTDYDQMLDLLRYFTVSARLDSLRAAPPAERPQRWQEFMRATDPDSTTEQNEALNEYFSRLIAANARFRQEGIPGWRTDRGEVYITLGDPDEVLETPVTQVRLIRWTYTRYRLFVYFEDSSGLGRFRMTNTSRSEFERVARTVRQGGPEGGVAH
jgi:GWxTD domain-containing protein